MKLPDGLGPESTTRETVRGFLNAHARIMAGIAGISIAAAGVIIAKHMRAAYKEAIELGKSQKEDENNG